MIVFCTGKRCPPLAGSMNMRRMITFLACMEMTWTFACSKHSSMHWGVCSHEKLTGHTSSVLCLLKLRKKKHNWLYSSGPSTFVTTYNITDCSSSVAIATAHCLRRLVKSICAANGHLVPVILCKECMLVDHGFQTISTCWQHQGRLCQTV